MASTMEKICITVEEMAVMLSISRWTAYELIKVEGFPLVHIGKRTVVSLEGLREWVRRGGTDDMPIEECPRAKPVTDKTEKEGGARNV